jgi:hypothetical protein
MDDPPRGEHAKINCLLGHHYRVVHSSSRQVQLKLPKRKLVHTHAPLSLNISTSCCKMLLPLATALRKTGSSSILTLGRRLPVKSDFR